MKTLQKLPLYLLSAGVFAFASCESDDPVIENDGELITDVTLHFTELDEAGNPTGPAMTFTAYDSEGIEVGTAPTVETVNLASGKSYLLEIEVANSIENEDITEEILEESDEHQFYFLGSAFVGTTAPLTYSYNDDNGELIGVKGTVMVVESPATNNAQIRIILRHDLDKNYPGADNPNFENYNSAGGESDLDITFPLVIE
ncbi:hypothetical protein [Algoriphagus vanfongensis]|uniref:hypothetical protein n=1 Tax=Algoriphagus vanfongensis TaxID=426371 RepID=UPI000409B44F|nr:hypothetical protein [Algoriphagus vanfongensis]